MTDVWKATDVGAAIIEELKNEICAMSATRRNSIVYQRFGFILTNLGVF
jgi:hypothetical protein